MKYLKIVCLLMIGMGTFSSCSNENTDQKSNEPTVATPTTESVYSDTSNVAKTEEEPLAEGAKLMKSTDCYSCHNLDATLIGPSFKKIAEKYPNNKKNVELLCEKVIKGGSGNWGQVPMQAHPTLDKAEVEKMVDYILSSK